MGGENSSVLYWLSRCELLSIQHSTKAYLNFCFNLCEFFEYFLKIKNAPILIYTQNAFYHPVAYLLKLSPLCPSLVHLTILVRACSVPAVGVRAVDCWQWRSGHYFHPFFLCFFPVFSPPFFSPLRPFLIEGVLGSKNLFSESYLERPKT